MNIDVLNMFAPFISIIIILPLGKYSERNNGINLTKVNKIEDCITKYFLVCTYVRMYI